jgi:hypothetical protein
MVMHNLSVTFSIVGLFICDAALTAPLRAEYGEFFRDCQSGASSDLAACLPWRQVSTRRPQKDRRCFEFNAR